MYGPVRAAPGRTSASAAGSRAGAPSRAGPPSQAKRRARPPRARPASSASSRTEVGSAAVALVGGRLVGGRGAADGGGHVAPRSSRPSSRRSAVGWFASPRGAAREEPVAGSIAGEHAPGPVAAVGGRGQPHREGSARADRRSPARAAPSSPAAVSARRLGGRRLAPCDEARAHAAGRDPAASPARSGVVRAAAVGAAGRSMASA